MDNKKIKQIQNLSDREKSFYHDLINHTHGLLLYLSHKKKSGKVELSEIESIVREIELIQNIIKTHFNEELDSELISMKQFIDEIDFLIEAYLKSVQSVDFHKIIDDQFLNQEFITQGKSHLVRFLANHFKNMAESSKSKIEIKIIFDGQYLELSTKNDISDQVCRSNGGLGIGLRSMKIMSDFLGGHFQFSNDGIYWYCSLKIKFLSSLDFAVNAA